MRHTFRLLSVSAALLMVLTQFTACGNSVLGETAFSPTDILTRLRVATTDAQFQSIANDAAAICQNAQGAFSDSVAAQHCAYQSEALALISDVDPIGILSDLTTLAGTDGAASSVYEQLNIPVTDAENIFASATAINSITGELTNSQQIQKATVNTYSIIALFNLRYVIDHNGLHNRFVPFDIEGEETTYTAGYRSTVTGPNQDVCGTSICKEFENLNFVADGLVANNYVENANSAFQASAVLSTEQSEQTDELVDESEAFVSLRNAVVSANTNHVINGEAFNFNQPTLSDLETEIHDALDKIFGTN